MTEKRDYRDSMILIVEDKTEFATLLKQILLDAGWKRENIVTATNTNDAIEALEDYSPDIVLQDLQIPYGPEGKPEIKHSAPVLDSIELLNYRKNLDIKVIVISASVEDEGVQKLITGDRSRIFKFVNKISLKEASNEKISLIKLIERLLSEEREKKAVEYNSIRRTALKELKKWDEKLWKKVNDFILQPFEDLFIKKANIQPGAKQIIGTCGEIVEDIIQLIKDDSFELANDKYSDDFRSVRNSLTALTGRKYIYSDKIYQSNLDDIHISRPAAEYAAMAYRLRSEALHSTEADEKNSKLFKDHGFTREDAAVSINLIVPLLNDYISYLKRKSKLKK